jgi:ATP-dependent Clp protease protease subunit
MNSPVQPSLPIVVQQTDSGQLTFDIYSRLLAERIIFVKGELTDEKANLIIAQILFLDAQDPEKDITLYINSSEGAILAAIAIYDTMQQIRSELCTVCIGTAAAMGAFLLSSGTKGKRYALPNARITLRQPSASAQGKSTDIEVAAKEILYLRETINKILSANTGQSKERIEIDSERDFFMSAEQAKAYGLIDNIITKPAA